MSDNSRKTSSSATTLDPSFYAAARRYSFTLVPNDEGGYHVVVPGFEERIFTGGMTPEEAAANAVEALALALEWYAKTGNTPPAPAVATVAA